MKQKVIEFLQNLPKEKYDQFNEAFELYRKSPGKNLSVERSVNSAGFSERSLENLLYDLQKLHGITDVEKIASVHMAVVSDQSEEGTEVAKWDSLDPEIAGLFKSILRMTPEHRNEWGVVRQNQFGDVEELLVLAVCVGLEEVSACLKTVLDCLIEPDLTLKNIAASSEDVQSSTEANLIKENADLTSEKEDLEFEKDELEEENEALKDKLETLQSLPKIDAKSIRVEFPFLNEKECPDEFKILVADKITAWNTYLENHADLLKIESGELVTDDKSKAEIAASAIASFDENQKIYDELNAYQTTGKVLGLHPIFKRLQLTREVEEMTADELVKYKSSSAKYFTDNRQSLVKAEKAKNTEKIELITNRVAEREIKLALVNKKLGINPK